MSDVDDRREIEDLIASYALTLDAEEIEACVQLFVPEGGFEVYGRVFSGQDGLRAMFTAAPRGLHLTGQKLVKVSGETATCRSQLVFIDASTHEMRLTLYDDTIVRAGGQWRFSHRRCQFLTEEGLRDRPGQTRPS